MMSFDSTILKKWTNKTRILTKMKLKRPISWLPLRLQTTNKNKIINQIRLKINHKTLKLHPKDILRFQFKLPLLKKFRVQQLTLTFKTLKCSLKLLLLRQRNPSLTHKPKLHSWRKMWLMFKLIYYLVFPRILMN